MSDIKKIIYVLKNSDVSNQMLPPDLYAGEPIVNTSDGILFFSGVSSTSPNWTPAGTGYTANFFEVGSNLYDLQLRHRLITYDGVTDLTGKFLSGTTDGFVLADISSLGGGSGGTGIDTYVTGGTYNRNTGVATFKNNYGGTFPVTGFSTTYFDTYVTGGTYSNGTATFRNNTGGTFNVTGFYTGSNKPDIYVTGGTLNQSTGIATFINATGGTFNVSGFSTIYSDVYVVGGSYANGVATFVNTTGGTFSVTGFNTGGTGGSSTDTYVTGGTLNQSTGIVSFINNYGNIFTVDGFSTIYHDTYVTGGTYSNGTATFVNNTGGTFSISGFTISSVETDTLQSVTDRGTTTSHNITANSFVKSGGTGNQFLKADGSTDSNNYLTSESDTLQSVTDRGNNTNNNISANSFIVNGGTSSEFLKADGTTDPNTYLTSENDSLQSVTDRGNSTDHNIIANGFIKQGGNSDEFLKADGSIDSNTYLTSESDTLQSVTDRDATTNHPITANSFIKQGGTSSEFLMADGSTSLATVIGPEIYVTGGTYSNGTATFTNNTGGTFTVTGFTVNTSGGTGTDTFVTGGTYNNTTATTTLTKNDGTTVNITGYTTGVFTQDIVVSLSSGKSLGKYTNGQTIPAVGKTFQDVMMDIAAEFIAPVFSNFTRTGLIATYEIGQNATIGSQTFTWGFNPSANVSANTITIQQNFTSVVTLTANTANDGSEILTTTQPIFSNTPLSNKVIYTISAKDTQGNGLSRTITANWQTRWYYGKFSGSTITAGQITGLTSNALTTSVTGAYYNFPTGTTAQYSYFIIPVGFTQPTGFKDSISGCFGNDVPMDNLGTVVITNQYGVATTYNQYKTTNPTSGSINIWLC